MYLETLRTFCLQKAATTESTPFGDDTLVFKVAEKMYALASFNPERNSVNLKCDPEYALELREKHPEITPGWHMNKKHWNTVQLGGGLPDSLIFALVNHSYDLVVQSLPKSVQKSLTDV